MRRNDIALCHKEALGHSHVILAQPTLVSKDVILQSEEIHGLVLFSL